MKAPEILKNYADTLEQKIAEIYSPLAPLARQCYLNTIETTVEDCKDGEYFVITGDIPAMWLRDSAAQVRPYIALCPESDELCNIIIGIIRKHVFYVNHDPYSNAFNKTDKKKTDTDDTDFTSNYIWERKYEVDSLCASVFLAYDYYVATSDKSIFSNDFRKMLTAVYDTFQTEQRHDEQSSYYFIRTDCPRTDTIPNGGHGYKTGYTGMTWSGFRPSDDCCELNYLIPSNMMAVCAMKKAAEMLTDGYADTAMSDNCIRLSEEIKAGIENFGTYNHPDFGKIYAYETDGLGNYILMDDANSPSLLSAPYIGYCGKDDEIYLNTRRFILSSKNPYYFDGTAAHGIGSPHTGKDKIWHISLIMQILTSTDNNEIQDCLKMLSLTHAGTNYMHESFNKDNPDDFTRKWFAWANTLFAQMLGTLI